MEINFSNCFVKSKHICSDESAAACAGAALRLEGMLNGWHLLQNSETEKKLI
jgi:hypothetical protein